MKLHVLFMRKINNFGSVSLVTIIFNGGKSRFSFPADQFSTRLRYKPTIKERSEKTSKLFRTNTNCSEQIQIVQNKYKLFGTNTNCSEQIEMSYDIC